MGARTALRRAGRCDACGGDYANLHTHFERQHPEALPYPCDECTRRFTSIQARWQHKGIAHDAERRSRNDPRRQRDWNLRKLYGITLAEFEAMLAAQGGRCATCSAAATSDARHSTLHVDHDHVTGRVRGLLCSGCNHALGKVNDDPVVLRALADYLDRGGTHG